MSKFNTVQNFKFSIIIPVYNVQDYLEEAILSVINQTIGFKKNVQLVLVNDGSVDNSKKICEKYLNSYPNNVVYLEQQNSGVSVARNAGLKLATGEFVNFLDSDDKLGLDVLEKVYAFFELHYDEIDVASCRVYQFDAVEKFHILDYRFDKGDRVVDIQDPECYRDILLHVSSTFFKRSEINGLLFDKNVKYGEDSLFVNQMVLKKAKYGIVASALHYYRRRTSGTSAVQNQHFDINYYTESPKIHYSSLIELSKEKFGCVIPYIQNILVYDIAWRVKGKIPSDSLFDDKFKEEYFNFLKDILKYIDVSVILNLKVNNVFMLKNELILLKTGRSLLENLKADSDSNSLYFDENRVISFNMNMSNFFVNILKIEQEELKVEGLVSKWIFDVPSFKKVRFYFTVNDIELPVKLSDFSVITEIVADNCYDKFYRFSLSVNLNDFFVKRRVLRIKPYFEIDGKQFKIKLNYKKFVPNNIVFKPCYKFFKRYYTTCSTKQIRVVKPKNVREEHNLLEKECLNWLKENGLNEIRNQRIRYHILGRIKDRGKRIWLVSDRFEKAGDNGEAFFKFLSTKRKELKKQNIVPIFIISKYSSDKRRLRKYGRVMHFEDKNYPAYFLRAEKIISSSGGEFTINPFDANSRKYFVDLMKFEYVFLQHGVIFNDLSKWLYKYNKNISKFITSSKYERDSIINGDYGYTDENVILTGLPRFDYLENKPEKSIVIMPTWRRSINQSYDKKTQSIYFDKFKETNYFKFYNSLINDERLLNIMRAKGYKGTFCLHPIHSKQYIDFSGNDVFSINANEVNYKEVFSKNSLLVTDYSSVFSDFAYLRKPVLFTMFDKDAFFEEAIYDAGYYDFEKHGFGPVCYDYETTVEKLIEFIENDCKIDDKYLEKINDFYEYNDTDNCQRIYEEIVKI